MAQKLILSYGEALWDLLPTGPVLGGAPCNFAYRINSLGNRGILVSRLGSDALGEKARQQIASLGMDTSMIQTDPKHATGTVQVTLDAHKNPDYFIVPDAAYDFIEPAQELLDLARKADCICFGTLVQRSPASRNTLQQILKQSQALKLLDINLRKNCYTPETIQDSLAAADILKLNQDEADYLARLFGFPASDLTKIGQHLLERWDLLCCVMTLGEQGALAMMTDGRTVREPGHKVKLVDPCGSGDAFTAGFLHSFLEGQPLKECCRLGNALGALVATQNGATAPLSSEEIRTFLRRKTGS